MLLNAAREAAPQLTGKKTLSHWFYNLPVLDPLIMSEALHTFFRHERSGRRLVTAASSVHITTQSYWVLNLIFPLSRKSCLFLFLLFFLNPNQFVFQSMLGQAKQRLSGNRIFRFCTKTHTLSILNL